jgi:hypothetical protein
MGIKDRLIHPIDAPVRAKPRVEHQINHVSRSHIGDIFDILFFQPRLMPHRQPVKVAEGELSGQAGKDSRCSRQLFGRGLDDLPGDPREDPDRESEDQEPYLRDVEGGQPGCGDHHPGTDDGQDNPERPAIYALVRRSRRT